MRYLRRLLGVLRHIPQTCFRAWERFVGSLPLWFRLWLRARFHIEDRVSNDLIDRAQQAEGFIGKNNWLDRDVLAWDYEVRSILRKHLGPDHLNRYDRKTSLETPQEEDDVEASAEALKRAQHEIRASAWALRSKTIVPRGGLSEVWWFRAAVIALMGPSAAGLIALIVTFSGVTAGGGPSLEKSSNPTFGTVQNIVEDPGKVVEITPTPSPTPAALPTPTPDLPDPQEPVINPPADPEEDQPEDKAEMYFLEGVAALDDGDFQAAVDAFEAAIDTEQGFVRAYYNLAVAYENIGTEESVQKAVEAYSAAIELWVSLESDGHGLLFEAKLGRGLLRVTFSSDPQEICLGRSDLLDYLERGDPSERNTEAVQKALAGIEEKCEQPETLA